MIRRSLPVAAFGLGIALAIAFAFNSGDVRAAARTRELALDRPDAVCASCHRAIYDRYERTSMALGSGQAEDAPTPGEFHHAESGIDYRVFARDGAAWMSFARDAASPKGALAGERRLDYFIGSGHRGRTYLYEDSGQWFELPVNFYTRRQAWGMAPAFDHVSRMPNPLPVDPNCLHCHASEVQASETTARNRYRDAPFRQGGVGCSACHGDSAAHLATKGVAAIVNPAKLAPARRDSVCLQCHLEGDAVVYRPGRSIAQFKAGDVLDDFAVYFVRKQEAGGGRRATSQYEALLRSACKRASGDRLTCTTCHDPHSDPAPAERVAYYRARCLSCHTGERMAAHHPEQPDCASCHMPSRSTTDISHEQVTDHDIEARPRATARATRAADLELVAVGDFAADDRSLGLAYAQMAERGAVGAAAKALWLLNSASEAGGNDPELNARLGYLRQTAGDAAGARTAYAAALAEDPWEPTALANLAVLDAQTGRTREAIALLDRLVADDPTQTAAGLNLVFIECRVGHAKEALALATRLLQANPDYEPLRAYLRTGVYAGEHCALPPAR